MSDNFYHNFKNINFICNEVGIIRNALYILY